ncbi:hypothetical protein GH714_028739 [Hevea brasiliensis]|uniref:Leucine-rich repeat-containing N-terminal plant-type domain-containing protein n=1 Tax=Hevea brasiliensis TaxID=3981 RepID=A0A6A6NKN0_HEVBR|nr:hypothetical protein GH714_028739 [Hevea brasiliensis]
MGSSLARTPAIPIIVHGLVSHATLNPTGGVDGFEGNSQALSLKFPFRRNMGFREFGILDLEGNLFTGKLPSGFVGFVGSFFKLRGLYLANNKLNGTVPAVLGSKCQYFQHLDLSGNSLLGGIPYTLGNCRRLRMLLLFSNKLNGEIPRELGQLGSLEVLDISRNFINGMIPSELGHCAELSVLVLSSLFEMWPNDKNKNRKVSVSLPTVANHEYNHFQGSIPTEITALPKL